MPAGPSTGRAGMFGVEKQMQAIWIVINTMLPVYFFNVLNVDRIQLALIQFIAYLSLFSKPIFAIYFDKTERSKKPFLLLSVIGMILSFILFIINLNFLISIFLYID